MVANIRGYTPNYSFKLINFDTPRWHTLEYSNWNMVDAMFLQNGTPQMRGVWQNNTAYLEGDRVFDEETSAVYRCLVEHESAELGTFAADRTANPTYWSLQLSGTPVYRGEWLPGVTYVLGDIVVVDDYEYFLCTQGNVSSGDFSSDATKWQTIFDATQVVADAVAAKDAAYQFSLDAGTSAANALTSENNAEAAETGAQEWADDARAASGAFRWAFSTGTTAVDPAIGRLAFNNANPALVTEIYLSAQSAEQGNPDVSSWVVTWDDSTNPNTRGTVQIRKVGAPEQFLIFNIINAIIDNGSWLRLPVAYVSHSGTLVNAEPLSVGFVRAGNVGPTGTGGGDMLKANNLNDVANIGTSRTNLGLGTTQIPTFSEVLLTSPPTVNNHAATKAYVDASPSTYVADTLPPLATTQDGSLWWDSDKGTLFVLYNDGTSRQWVEAVAVPGLDTTGFVLKSGSTMTGALTLPGNPTSALQAVPKQYVDAIAPVRGHIHGMHLVYEHSYALTIQVGECTDDTGTVLMKLSTPLVKSSMHAWVEGDNVGAWDGVGVHPADGSFHIFVIQRSDTGRVDVLMSSSATAPTMPPNYDRKRRVGSWIRMADANKVIFQHGDWFCMAQHLIYNHALSYGPTTFATLTPSGVKTKPILVINFQEGPSGGDTSIYLFPGDDVGYGAAWYSHTVNLPQGRQTQVVIAPPTDETSVIRIQVAVSTPPISMGQILSLGWIDERGRTY